MKLSLESWSQVYLEDFRALRLSVSLHADIDGKEWLGNSSQFSLTSLLLFISLTYYLDCVLKLARVGDVLYGM